MAVSRTCVIVLLLYISCLDVPGFCDAIRQLGWFNVPFPEYCTLYENRKPNSSEVTFDLLTSTQSFNLRIDDVTMVENIGQFMGNLNTVTPKEITKNVNSPNEISGIPEFIFGKRMIAIPEGSIASFNQKGAIGLLDVSKNASRDPYVITDSVDGNWIYHRVEWVDMDGDKDMDIITCRAKQINGMIDSELLWLENPSGDYQKIWQSHILAHSADTFFQYAFLPTPDGPKECIVVAGLFSRSLSIFWPEDHAIRWKDQSNIKNRTVDSLIGSVFDVSVTDVNGDGRKDLLVTNNDNYTGGVFAYEVPTDFRNGTFVRHILTSGIRPIVREMFPGDGAPGGAKPVYINQTKPIIFLSGHNSGKAYYLVPKSQSSADWNYLLATLFKADGVKSVGELAIADVDNDGYDEIFVPSYTTSQVFVYTVGP